MSNDVFLNLAMRLDTRLVNAEIDAAMARMQHLASKTGGNLNPFQSGLFQRDLAFVNKNMVQFEDITNKSTSAMGRLGRQSDYVSIRLSSFAMYRGFVFLEQGLISSTKAMIDLNHQVSLIMTQLPKFGEGMRGVVTNEIVRVAKETGQTFQAVGDALYQVTSAGYAGAEAFRALELSSKAAVAGGTDAASAFNSAFSQLSAFNLGIYQLGEVYDKQFNLVRRGIFTYGQLTTVVGITAEAFDQAGQSIDTANAALATISEVFTGPQLRRGATALRSFTLAVADSPKVFAAFGIATRDAGGIRGLIPILEDIQKLTSNMTTDERATFISTIVPDGRQQAGIIALLNNMDSLRRNYVEQKLALGDLDKAYKVVHGDIATQTQTLKDNLQSGFAPMARTIGAAAEGLNAIEKFLPGLTSNLLVMTTGVAGAGIAYAALKKETLLYAEAQAIANQEMVQGTAYGVSRMSQIKGFFSTSAFRLGGTAIAAGALGSASTGLLHNTGSRWENTLLGFGAGASTGIAVGAAVGLLSGGVLEPLTIAISGIIGGIGGALSGWSKELPQAGKDFATAFAQALKEQSGDVASALAQATSGTTKKATDEFLANLAHDRVQTGETPGMSVWERMNHYGLLSGIFRDDGSAPTFGPGQAYFREAFDMVKTRREQAMSQENQATLRAYAATNDVNFDDLNSAMLKAVERQAIAAALPNNEIAQKYAELMIDSSKSLEEFNILLGYLVNSEMDKFNQAIVDASSGMPELPKAIEEIVLNSSSLAKQLFNASDLVRNGLIDGAGFAADELEMLGEEFQELNKAVFKVDLLKELAGIGEFLGIKKGFLDPAIKEILDAAKVGGQGLRDLLTDPKKLAEFLTSIEFGDITVDNSTQNNIVVRISGGEDLNVGKAAEFADAIVAELNNANRRRSGAKA